MVSARYPDYRCGPSGICVARADGAANHVVSIRLIHNRNAKHAFIIGYRPRSDRRAGTCSLES
ncbi:hypothetical protein [Arthrobacter sp. D3-16]